ncbi:MAG: isochorismate synthase [Candidatus Palauibacterales bacterium]|nr:isochorismate synthase [Candidatus Palauibacterales bacterium]
MQKRAEQPRPLGSVGDERPVRLRRCGRLVTAGRRVDATLLPEDPGLILGTLEAPRGAWERDGRRSVHGGTAALVEPDADDGGRFSSVRRRAEAWTGTPGRDGGGGGSAPPLPRLYGGFSFHAAPDVSGAWSDFPAGRFRVPAHEVRLDGDGAWLLATREDDGTAAEDAREGLRRLEERIERALSAGEEGGSGPRPTGTGLEERVAELTDGGGPAYAGAERERWIRGVREALEEVRGGRLEKVVLARTLDVAADSAASPVRAYRRLRADNPRSSLFFLQPEPGTAFLGASPELLGAARGSVFRATAVAGSVPRGESGEEDRALGRALLESDKDRREQAIVAEEIRRCLVSRLGAVSVGAPRLLKLARIQHLESAVEGRLPAGRDLHLLDLLADLHPTPAVCGRPRDRALETLRRSEPFERGWYAGPVGWFGPSGQGEFVPGLRSAVLHGGAWRLFAGAGIVEGSDPVREWEETGVKFVPMLRALDVGSGS